MGGAVRLSTTYVDFANHPRVAPFDTHGPSGGETDGCLAAAGLVYDGVRAFGGSSFF